MVEHVYLHLHVDHQENVHLTKNEAKQLLNVALALVILHQQKTREKKKVILVAVLGSIQKQVKILDL